MNTAKDIDTAAEPQKITANEITLVDRHGKPRIHMSVEDDGTAAVKFLDGEEHLRMAIYLKEPNLDDEDLLTDSGSDNDAGLIVTGRQSRAMIRLGISGDGLYGKRARLEINEGSSWSKKRHRFPAIPPHLSD